MFEHLKISSIKGLKGCQLLDLGRINVICGKNNSGKSTILEGISEYRASGKQFDEKEIDKFFEGTVDALGLGRVSRAAIDYHSCLKTVLASRETWYADDNDHITFVNTLQQELAKTLPGLFYTTPVINNMYNASLEKRETAILIPPKRHLDLNTQINAKQPINPQGDGILNYLFYAKNQIINSEDRGVYDQIMDAFSNISSDYTFDILMDKNNLLTLRFSYKDHPWIDAQYCGLGLQDLLVLLYFSIHPQSSVVLIEEPESHIHPDMQRRLLYFLREKTSKQFFLTTHSNVFLNNPLVDRVFFTQFEDSVKVDDATSRAIILNSLGYAVTDNLVSDLIILTEGLSDRPVIEEFLVKFGLFGLYDIKIWPLGGDIMGQVDLSVFVQNYSIIALIDNDPGSNNIREKFIKNCDKYNIPYTRLTRYAIENYFSLRAIRGVFKGQIPSYVTCLDPDIKLEKQIGIDVKKKNWNIAKEMDISEIEGTDLYDFFTKVKNLCEKDAKHKNNSERSTSEK